MGLAIQLTGAAFILVAFVAMQMGRISSTGVSYLVANMLGSVLLAIDALNGEQWGFVLLEVVWFAVSVWSLVRVFEQAQGQPRSLIRSERLAVVDFATRADLAGRLRGLVILLDEHLTLDQCRAADQSIDADEYAAALEMLADWLAEAGDPDPRRHPP